MPHCLPRMIHHPSNAAFIYEDTLATCMMSKWDTCQAGSWWGAESHVHTSIGKLRQGCQGDSSWPPSS